MKLFIWRINMNLGIKKNNFDLNVLFVSCLFTVLASVDALSADLATTQRYTEKPYWQDSANKYQKAEASGELIGMAVDRNGITQVLADDGLQRLSSGALVRDGFYRPMNDMKLVSIVSYQQQFVYLSDKEVFSNAWAGKFRVEHRMPDATELVMGPDFSFVVLNNTDIAYFRDGKVSWQAKLKGKVAAVEYDVDRKVFLVLGPKQLVSFSLKSGKRRLVYKHKADGELRDMARHESRLVIASSKGLFSISGKTYKNRSKLETRLPNTDLTSLELVDGRLWLGSHRGLFVRKFESKNGLEYDYYASKRWLLEDSVLDIKAGLGKNVLVLTSSGLNEIVFESITLADKAQRLQKIQRQRHIRYGFSSYLRLQEAGDLSSGRLRDTDNDGLWTSMYLAAELFRYGATGSDDALQNAYEAFEAMEHLDFINPISGFPSRTFERENYPSSKSKRDDDGELIWRLTEDKAWRWKSTTSSDESSGHYFVYALFAEIVPDESWKQRAIKQIIRQTDHIIDNDWYLVSWNNKPTLWGRWHPDYVNSFPAEVGDRRLNSTLIVAFLQTAYHFSGNEKYKQKAEELMNQHGYLENLLRSAQSVGFVEDQFLSDGWNHSDDEMYFLTTPALHKYAFTDTLRDAYDKTITSHWQLERSEQSPLWNFLYQLSGGETHDLDVSVDWLQAYPIDLVSWSISNSHRTDLTLLKDNFRGQIAKEILPPDERPLHLHNGPNYRIDKDEKGMSEYPPYVFLLPYWLGRYLGVIQPADISSN